MNQGIQRVSVLASIVSTDQEEQVNGYGTERIQHTCLQIEIT